MEVKAFVKTLSNLLRLKAGAKNVRKFLTQNINLGVQRINASSVLESAIPGSLL